MSIRLSLSSTLAESHPADAARILEGLPPGEAATTLAHLPMAAAAQVIARMEAATAAACLTGAPKEMGQAIAGKLPREAAARLLGSMAPDDRESLLSGLPEAAARTVRLQLQHQPGTAAALMDCTVLALPADITAGEARTRIARRAVRVLFYIYVVDREHRLVGVVNLRELMRAPAGQAVSAIMRRCDAVLSVFMRSSAILRHPGWQSFHALPVVDGSGVLWGVLPYDTLRRLESSTKPDRSPDPLALGFAMAELYWSTTAVLMREISQAAGVRSRRVAEERPDGP